MFIRGKPAHFGYKIWALCSTDGYPFQLQLYGGAIDKTDEPLGYRVVRQLLQVCEKPEEHTVTFDNFFSSHDLMLQLKDAGFRATGTVRNNRTNRCPLDSREMKKKEKGAMDWRCDGSFLICQWNNSAVVNVISNHSTVNPTKSAKRWSKSAKQFCDVKQPRVVNEYNLHMGGVDVMDQLLESCRPTLRSKKWYWNLFSNGLNLSVVACWRLHQYVVGKNDSINHLEFRRSLTMALLHIYLWDYRVRQGGPTASITPEIRYDTNISPFFEKMCTQLFAGTCCRTCYDPLHGSVISCSCFTWPIIFFRFP